MCWHISALALAWHSHEPRMGGLAPRLPQGIYKGSHKAHKAHKANSIASGDIEAQSRQDSARAVCKAHSWRIDVYIDSALASPLRSWRQINRTHSSTTHKCTIPTILLQAYTRQQVPSYTTSGMYYCTLLHVRAMLHMIYESRH